MATEFGSELYMSVTGESVSEEEAIVQMIQNICFIEPGTYPNDPDLGLGIENEQFELIDSNYTDKLKNKLDLMIESYIPTDYYIETRVSYKNVSLVSSQKVLLIEVFVGPTPIDLSKITLLFTRMPSTNKLKFNILR